jgi:hypothetical protein
VLHNAPITGALDFAATQPWPDARSETMVNKNNEIPHSVDLFVMLHLLAFWILFAHYGHAARGKSGQNCHQCSDRNKRGPSDSKLVTCGLVAAD